MTDNTWDSRFAGLFDRCAAAFRSGQTDYEKWFSTDDRAFLASIGYKAQEFFDFVDDHCRYGDLPASTALLVADVRRDYFRSVQGGQPSARVIAPSELPPKAAAADGIPWLPRIIAKARAKLAGEMHPDIMFGCGGDRGFLRRFDIQAADFLKAVWRAGEDDQAVIDWVKSRPVNEAHGPF